MQCVMGGMCCVCLYVKRIEGRGVCFGWGVLRVCLYVKRVEGEEIVMGKDIYKEVADKRHQLVDII